MDISISYIKPSYNCDQSHKFVNQWECISTNGGLEFKMFCKF